MFGLVAILRSTGTEQPRLGSTNHFQDGGAYSAVCIRVLRSALAALAA